MSWDDGAHRSERRLLIWTLEACFGMYFFRPFEKFESDAGQVLSIVALRASHVMRHAKCIEDSTGTSFFSANFTTTPFAVAGREPKAADNVCR